MEKSKILKNSKKNKLARRHGLAFNVFATILWIWAISQIALIFWGLMISFRDEYLYDLNTMKIFPENFKFQFVNYKKAITKLGVQTLTRTVQYPEMIWNSVWFSIGATFMKLMATTLLAYVIAQYNFFGKKVLYGFLIVQIMLPIYGQTTANYRLMDNIGFIDSPLFLLGLGAGHGMHFLIMHSYFENISATYREAATIDGANDFTIFFRIMLPLGMGAVIAIGLLSFIGTWGDYATAMLYLPSFPTLSAGLYSYQNGASVGDLKRPVYFAAIFMSALPTATLFIVFNKTLMENVTIGGIKG